MAAAHRSRNLLNSNSVLWLGEIKQRRDPRLPARLLVKDIKESYERNPTVRCSPPIWGGDESKSHADRVMYLPSPVMSLYPTHFHFHCHPVLQLSAEVLHSQSAPSSQKSEAPPSPSPGSDKPSLDQLLHVYNCLQTNLPKLFTSTMDYTIYAQDVVLINNILNKTTVGLFKYVQQVSLFRVIGHFKFAFVKLELVSMSQDPLEGRITVRWRVVGISGLRVMLKFWKFKVWKYQEMIQQQEIWHDAISHFDVGADGLIHRHIIDKVEEDKERSEVEKRVKSPLLAKLALIAALFPRNEVGAALAVESIVHCGGGTRYSSEESDASQQHPPLTN